ncbi:hypothetical protein ABH926_008284 [Catenulispora sp. GP43]|uniref:hypothetical protein n=1 Tax=Catenulispora sp. GP43 TaxID=3156263 RepID=UPI0035138532
MSMQITRPVMQRGSSAPGLLLPIGTPASQPEPLLVLGGVLGLVVVLAGVGVVGCVDGAVVVGLVLGFELELGAEDELDDAALLVGAIALLVGSEVGVGVGADALDEGAVEEVLTPAACCTASAEVVLVPPEPDEHPVTPSATAPATAIKAPRFPAPEVLMLLSTPKGGLSLRP